jgi:hypothetical protein
MVSDLESHISKVPVYVCYLLKYIQRKIKKELKKKKADKKEFEKLKFSLFRLFFKNIISKLMKSLASENSDYLMKLMNYSEKNEIRGRVE